MQRLELVIFDCDGVLVDSEVIGNAIMAENLSTHGLEVSLSECMALFAGATMAGVKVKAEGLGVVLPADRVARIYKDIYARLRQGCPLIEGLVEDSLSGIRGAAAAGMRCFAYAPGHGDVEGATRFTHMAELPALLGLGGGATAREQALSGDQV